LVDSLSPGESATITAEYIITIEDMYAGEVNNTALAAGKDENGNDVNDTSDAGTDPDGNTIANPKSDGDSNETVIKVSANIEIPDYNHSVNAGDDANITDIANNKDINKSSVKFIAPDNIDATLSPDGKTLSIPGEGVWRLDAQGNATFSPEEGFYGNPTPVEYTAKSIYGKDAVSNGTLTVIYGPTATDNEELNVTLENYEQGITIDLTTNDKAANGNVLVPSSIQLVAPSNGTLSSDGKTVTVIGEGVWTADEDGKVTFTPEDGFIDSPTPINYTIRDNNNLVSNTAQIKITVAGRTSVKAIYWIDGNGNNLPDTNEERISNATVELIDSEGNIVATGITDANGEHIFENLAPAEYKVRFKLPQEIVDDGYSAGSTGDVVSVNAVLDSQNEALADAVCKVCTNSNNADALGTISAIIMLVLMGTIIFVFRLEES